MAVFSESNELLIVGYYGTPLSLNLWRPQVVFVWIFGDYLFRIPLIIKPSKIDNMPCFQMLCLNIFKSGKNNEKNMLLKYDLYFHLEYTHNKVSSFHNFTTIFK